MAKTQVAKEHDFVAKMEKSLNDLKREIFSNLVVSNEDFKEIVEAMDPKDLADVASDDIDRKMIEAIGSQELKRLRMIESALTRIQQGKYGLCMKCGKKIPRERLEAIPYALMCIECKTAEEKRNR
jgi:RNA polymerase-binding protein DksA